MRKASVGSVWRAAKNKVITHSDALEIPKISVSAAFLSFVLSPPNTHTNAHLADGQALGAFGSVPADQQDFPCTVIDEAAGAFAIQLCGLEILRFNAARSSGEAGKAGKIAVENLGDQFDLLAADLIATEVVKCDQSLFDLALGVLPLLPLALHLWYHSHSPISATTLPPLLLVARAVNMLGQGSVPRFEALSPVISLFGPALSGEVSYDPTAVYKALMEAMARVQHLSFPIAAVGKITPADWTHFASAATEDFSARSQDDPELRMPAAELKALILRLQHFVMAQAKFEGRLRLLGTDAPAPAFRATSAPDRVHPEPVLLGTETVPRLIFDDAKPYAKTRLSERRVTGGEEASYVKTTKPD